MAHELAIIGAGMMAEAIARGIVSGGALRADQIIAADLSIQRRELFQNEFGIATVERAEDAVRGAKVLLLCVKPYQMEAVIEEIWPDVDEKTLVISIAAGIGTGLIEKNLGRGKLLHVIRSMPNTPMLVGCGMVAIAAGKYATDEDLATARRLFESGGKVLQTSEEKIDAVTAISGSGPAYFFFLAEQMIRAGMDMGLAADEARTLAIQTAAGAAKMMSESSDLPEEHRKRVTTPNGTTHAAISHMEARDWPGITVEALKAAAKRSAEMGK